MRQRVFAGHAMGSALLLTVLGGTTSDAARAWEAASGEMAAADADLSRFLADSALTESNRLASSGRWTSPPARLRRMLVTSDRAMRTTAGRFDPRIVDSLEAIGEAAGISLPAASSSARWLERRGRSELRTSAPADSGGIGKGLGLRWAMAAARRAAPALHGMLLDAGGDIIVVGRGPADGGWSVGIEDPATSERLLATVLLRGGAIATSSTSHRSWTHDGRRVHHLIDPRTGEPAETSLLAVTVAWPDPAWAEVWTKALFLAGRHAIGEEARARGLAAWWVEADGSLHMTPAARGQTTWVAGEASAA